MFIKGQGLFNIVIIYAVAGKGSFYFDINLKTIFRFVGTRSFISFIFDILDQILIFKFQV